MCEYIYLVQEREFIKTKEDIYKIGKSKQENLKRFNSYPNGSKLLIQCICSNCNKIERKLIKIFKDKYEQQRDIGHEYFKGNYNEMIKDIYENISSFIDDNIIEDTIIEEDVKVNEKTVVKKEVMKNNVVNKKIVKDVVVINKHINVGLYKCDYCNYISDRKYNVALHSNAKHKDIIIGLTTNKDNINDKIDIKCKKCTKQFFSKSNLIRHSHICKGIVNKLECQKCNKIFSCSSNKIRHIKTCKK